MFKITYLQLFRNTFSSLEIQHHSGFSFTVCAINFWLFIFFLILSGRFFNLLFIPNFLKFHNDMAWWMACFNCDTGHSAKHFNLLFVYYFFYTFFLPSVWFLFMRSWTTWIVDLIFSFVSWFLSSCFGVFIFVCCCFCVYSIFWEVL